VLYIYTNTGLKRWSDRTTMVAIDRLNTTSH